MELLASMAMAKKNQPPAPDPVTTQPTSAGGRFAGAGAAPGPAGGVGPTGQAIRGAINPAPPAVPAAPAPLPDPSANAVRSMYDVPAPSGAPGPPPTPFHPGGPLADHPIAGSAQKVYAANGNNWTPEDSYMGGLLYDH